MSLKLCYLAAIAIVCLFLCVYAAWAVVAGTRGGGFGYILQAFFALPACFGLIIHGVVFSQRLKDDSSL